MIELLVVIAMIAVLAALLLPVLSRAKFKGQSAVCKSNLRQMVVALNLYAEDYRVYPPWFVWVTPAYGVSWEHYLAWYLFRGDPSDPNAVTKLDQFYLCPAGVPRSPGPSSYGYNSHGVGDNYCTLGLGGHGDTLAVGLPILNSVSVVKNPSDMIAFGDFIVRCTDPAWDGSQPSALFRPAPSAPTNFHPPDPRQQPYFKRHSGRFNRGFSDGHIEFEDMTKPFKAEDDYLKRWNNDNQPHREAWIH